MSRPIRTYNVTVRVDITSIARDDPEREPFDEALAVQEAFDALQRRIDGEDVEGVTVEETD